MNKLTAKKHETGELGHDGRPTAGGQGEAGKGRNRNALSMVAVVSIYLLIGSCYAEGTDPDHFLHQLVMGLGYVALAAWYFFHLRADGHGKSQGDTPADSGRGDTAEALEKSPEGVR